MEQADVNSTVLGLAVGSVPIVVAIISRGTRHLNDKLDETHDKLDELQDKGDEQLQQAAQVHQQLDDKLDHVEGRVRHVEGEVETIRRHQLMDVLGSRHRSMRSWRRLLNRKD